MKNLSILLITLFVLVNANAQTPSVEVLNKIIAGFENQFYDLYGEEVSELEALYKSSVVFDERAEDLIYTEDYENPVYEVKYMLKPGQFAQTLENELSRFLLKNLKGWSYKKENKKSDLATHIYTKEGTDYLIELSIPRAARAPDRVLIHFYRSSE